MSLSFGNKEYRNLQEQVAKNKQDITNILEASKVLNQFGIRVVGAVETSMDLPTDYDGEYGDAYVVGVEKPYDYWIWTRPNIDTPEPHFFDIGTFPAPGPEGPKGPKGDTGPKGIPGQGLLIQDQIPPLDNYQLGTGWINILTMDFYVLAGTVNKRYWRLISNIKGERGLPGPASTIPGPKGDSIVGPQGPKGDAGMLVNIIGIVSSTAMLPSITTVVNQDAYLVGNSAPYEIYANIDGEWANLGYSSGNNSVGLLVDVGELSRAPSSSQLTLQLSLQQRQMINNNPDTCIIRFSYGSKSWYLRHVYSYTTTRYFASTYYDVSTAAIQMLSFSVDNNGSGQLKLITSGSFAYNYVFFYPENAGEEAGLTNYDYYMDAALPFTVNKYAGDFFVILFDKNYAETGDASPFVEIVDGFKGSPTTSGNFVRVYRKSELTTTINAVIKYAKG